MHDTYLVYEQFYRKQYQTEVPQKLVIQSIISDGLSVFETSIIFKNKLLKFYNPTFTVLKLM